MNDKNVQSFLEAIEPVIDAYQSIYFNFAAIKLQDKHHLLQGRLLLNTDPLLDMPNTYKTANIMVGSILIQDISYSIETSLAKILSGSLTISGQQVLFNSKDQQGHDTLSSPLFYRKKRP